MGTFILIMFLKTGYAGGALSQEFDSEAACRRAIVLAEQMMKSTWGSVWADCVPKGGDK